MSDIVIVGAQRTAIGKFGGALAKVPAPELGATVIRALLAQSKVSPDARFGGHPGPRARPPGSGQNPARQALLKAGIPKEVPAMTINVVCGSGLKAVMLAAQAIRCGDADIVIAGGQENMSASPHVLPGSRDGFRMGDAKLVDTMIVDGLWDVYNQYHMGVTAENVAKKHEITRAQQDEFAVASQNKAERAQRAGAFKDEITPVDDPAAQGRSRRVRQRRVHQGRLHARVDRGPAARVREGRHRHCCQCLGHQRRRGRRARDDGRARRQAGADPARAHQGLRHHRRRSGAHGHGPRAVVQAAASRRPAGAPPISISWRSTRPLPHRPAR